MRKVFVTARLSEPALLRLREHFDVRVHEGESAPTRRQLMQGGADCFAILTTPRDLIDAAFLDASGVRLVANRAVGYDNIDLEAARLKRVLVTNTPDVLTDATADLTLALILGVTRRVVEGDSRVRQGHLPSNLEPTWLGCDIRGRTLGIIGMGRIGRAVARRALAFGMRILYYGGRAESTRADACDLPDLLSQSDIVSIHCPLTAHTRHLIGERELMRMPQGGYLINTARAGIVDHDALYAALRSGHLGGAALDVHPLAGSKERPDERFFELANVVLTPHIGSATHETRHAMALRAIENLIAAKEGRRPPDCLT